LPAKADTLNPSFGCTSGCTSEAKTEPADPLALLAAALLALSPADRARLAALLAVGQGDVKTASSPTAGLPSESTAANP
jgi:hypothetical protein